MPLHSNEETWRKLVRESYPFVDICNVTEVLENLNITRPLFPMTWRFLPLLDPLVDNFLSRDSDAIITMREVAAVNQWLKKSNATFHLMRDHPSHCGVKILGGTIRKLRFYLKNKFKK